MVWKKVWSGRKISSGAILAALCLAMSSCAGQIGGVTGEEMNEAGGAPSGEMNEAGNASNGEPNRSGGAPGRESTEARDRLGGLL